MADPTIWVEAPARTPRTNTLLDVVGTSPFPGGRAMPVDYPSDGCEYPTALAKACYITAGPSSPTTKDFGDPEDYTTAPTVGVYAGVECFLNGGVENFRDLARRRLDLGASHVLEGVVVDYAILLANDLGDGADIIETVALVEQALADNVNAQGIILMGAANATRAAAAGLLIRNPLDGSLNTYLGTPVVVTTADNIGDRVIGLGPTHVWAGPVEEHDTMSLNVNTARALAEQVFAFSIDCGAWFATNTV